MSNEPVPNIVHMQSHYSIGIYHISTGSQIAALRLRASIRSWRYSYMNFYLYIYMYTFQCMYLHLMVDIYTDISIFIIYIHYDHFLRIFFLCLYIYIHTYKCICSNTYFYIHVFKYRYLFLSWQSLWSSSPPCSPLIQPRTFWRRHLRGSKLDASISPKLWCENGGLGLNETSNNRTSLGWGVGRQL